MPFLDELKIELREDGKRGWVLIERFRYRTNTGICIIVPKDFPTDGASIPRFFWRLIGDPMNTDYVEAAVVHDWLWHKALAGRCTFRVANRIFRQALAEKGISWWRRWAMWAAVTLRVWGR